MFTAIRNCTKLRDFVFLLSRIFQDTFKKRITRKYFIIPEFKKNRNSIYELLFLRKAENYIPRSRFKKASGINSMLYYSFPLFESSFLRFTSRRNLE